MGSKKQNSHIRAGLIVATIGLLLVGARVSIAGYGCPVYFRMLPWVESLRVEESTVVPVGVRPDWGGTRWARSRACSSIIPVISLTREEVAKLEPDLQGILDPEYKTFEQDFNQQPVECMTHNEFVYFGISFYGGEGYFGVGGLGRYDPGTKTLEVRRPELLRDASISKLEHDGEALWFATIYKGEGFSDPVYGLARYDWEQDKLSHYVGTNDGPCGFWVNDLHYHEGYLWVATDLGVSKYDKTAGQWEHFVLSNNANSELTRTTCDDLYKNLLSSLPDTQMDPKDGACPLPSLGAWTPRNTFRAYLKRFRPNLVESDIELKKQARINHELESLRYAQDAISRGDIEAAYRLIEDGFISEYSEVRNKTYQFLEQYPEIYTGALQTFSIESITESINIYSESARDLEYQRLSIYRTIAPANDYTKALRNFEKVFK